MKREFWDDVARKQKCERHGTASAYDELPPVGSQADIQRYLSESANGNTQAIPTPCVKPQLDRKPLQNCPVCGIPIKRLARHLRKTHGESLAPRANQADTAKASPSRKPPKPAKGGTTAAFDEKHHAELLRQFKQTRRTKKQSPSGSAAKNGNNGPHRGQITVPPVKVAPHRVLLSDATNIGKMPATTSDTPFRKPGTASPVDVKQPEPPSHGPTAMGRDMTKPNPIAEERNRLREAAILTIRATVKRNRKVK